jgi:hypothetical protein
MQRVFITERIEHTKDREYTGVAALRSNRICSWQLAIGSWQLAIGSWRLAIGNMQVARAGFEDFSYFRSSNVNNFIYENIF